MDIVMHWYTHKFTSLLQFNIGKETNISFGEIPFRHISVSSEITIFFGYFRKGDRTVL
jgi:hypothetical protein